MQKKEKDDDAVEGITPSFSVNIGMLKLIKNFTLPLVIMFMFWQNMTYYNDNKQLQQQLVTALQQQNSDKKEALNWWRNAYTKTIDFLMGLFPEGKKAPPGISQ